MSGTQPSSTTHGRFTLVFVLSMQLFLNSTGGVSTEPGMGTFILGLGAGISLFVLRGVARGLRWAVSRLWIRYRGPETRAPSPAPRIATPPAPDVNVPRVWVATGHVPPVQGPHYVWPGASFNPARQGPRGQRKPLGELWPNLDQGGPSHTSTPINQGTASTSPGAPVWRGSGTVSLNGGAGARSRASWTRLAGETSSRQTPRSSNTSLYHSAE